VINTALIWIGRIASIVMLGFAVVLAIEVSNPLLLMDRDPKVVVGILACLLAGLGVLTLIGSQILSEVSRNNNG
jgi:hypothetical protein